MSAPRRTTQSLRDSALAALTAEIMACRRCPRLVAWREQVAREKRAAYRDEEYWGRPGARASATRGRASRSSASRRPRTAPTAPGGCSPATAPATSSTPRCWRAGLASAPVSRSRDDGLALRGAYDHRRRALRAAGEQPDPRRARPLPAVRAARARAARATCRVIVCLGAFAWEAALRIVAPGAGPRPRFAHGAELARGAGAARELPPQPAEHLHRAPDRGDAGRGARARD